MYADPVQVAQRTQRKVIRKAVAPPSKLRTRFRFMLNIAVAVVVAIIAFYITSRSLSRPFCDTNVDPGRHFHGPKLVPI